MSQEIGNWKLDENWNRIISDIPVCQQTPKTTDYLNGYMVCDMIANKHIARRIIASVRACKDIILEDLEQADSGYWVKQAKTAADGWAKACEGWEASMAMNAELLEALKKIAEYEGDGPPTTPGKDIVQDLGGVARAAIARATGADTAQYSHSIDEQTEPDHSPADDAQDEAYANQPTPYDP